MSQVSTGERRKGDVGRSVQPSLFSAEPAIGKVCPPAGLDVLASLGEFGQFGVDGVETLVRPSVLGIPLRPPVDLGAEFLDAPVAADDLGFGIPDVAGEAVDLVEDRGLVLAAVAAELRERAELAEPLRGVVQPVVGPVQILLRRGKSQFCLTEGRPRPVTDGGVELGPFGEEALDVAGCIVHGEAGLREPAEGVEDLLFGGAAVGEDAAVVDVGEAGDVPGMGGVAGAALAGVAGEPLKGGGAQEMDLGPGTALDAVDDQRNAKLILNVVLGGDALGYDLYRRRTPGGSES